MLSLIMDMLIFQEGVVCLLRCLIGITQQELQVLILQFLYFFLGS
jgi:hypothetical protein